MSFRKSMTGIMGTAVFILMFAAALIIPGAAYAEDHAGTLDDPIPMELDESYSVNITEQGQEVVFMWDVPYWIDAETPIYFASSSTPELSSSVERQGTVSYGEGVLYDQKRAEAVGSPEFLLTWYIRDDIRKYLVKTKFCDETVTGQYNVMLRLTPDPYVEPDIKFKGFYDHILMTDGIDGNAYGIVISDSDEQPTSTDGVPFYVAKDGGRVIAGYGEVVPNKTYYVHACMKYDPASSDVTPWMTYQVKTAKVPKPVSVKATAGKKSMTVKWKSAGDSSFKYKVTYSAKGVKAKTVTVKVTEKNYKSPSVKIRKLKKGRKYTVKVQAIYNNKYKSDWSKKATSGKIK